ncbi:tetratricopeptide repeat protein [Elusimicrobiota bacterium]
MQSEDILSTAKFLIEKEQYQQTVDLLKKALINTENQANIFSQLSTVYIKLSENEGMDFYYSAAENAIRNAIKIEPERVEYHDILIEIMRRTNRIDKLSTEYNDLKRVNSNIFYNELLKKIAAISMLSLPTPNQKRPGKKIYILIVNYIIMPCIAISLVISWVITKIKFLRMPLTLCIVLYIGIRVIKGHSLTTKN